jgi:hypothetical protein
VCVSVDLNLTELGTEKVSGDLGLTELGTGIELGTGMVSIAASMTVW